MKTKRQANDRTVFHIQRSQIVKALALIAFLALCPALAMAQEKPKSAGASPIVEKTVSKELKGVIFDRDVDGEHMGQAARRPKLATTFQAVLKLGAGGFHRAGSNRCFASGQVGIVEVVAVVLEVVDLAADERIGWIPGQ